LSFGNSGAQSAGIALGKREDLPEPFGAACC
jgi:hypothetical protein